MKISEEEIEKEREYRIKNYKEFLGPTVIEFLNYLNHENPLNLSIKDVEYNCSFNPYCMDSDLACTRVYVNSSNIEDMEEFILETLGVKENEELEPLLETLKSKGYNLGSLTTICYSKDPSILHDIVIIISKSLTQYEDSFNELYRVIRTNFNLWLDEVEYSLYRRLAKEFNRMISDDVIKEDLEYRKELQGEE
jgi:hypothetical protein